MSIAGVRNGNATCYQETVSRTAVGQDLLFMTIEDSRSVDSIVVESPEKYMEEKVDGRNGEVPDQSAGTTFRDLMNSGRGRKNQIPIVNQIVSARNPEDGEIYRAVFTDEKIICNYGDGRRAWEIEIEDTQQAEKVKEYFGQFKPDRDWIKEYYSGDKMRMAVVQRFWLDLFEKG